MPSKRMIPLRHFALLLTFCAAFPLSAYAQTSSTVNLEKLGQWVNFWLVGAIIAGVAAGIFVGFTHLAKLKCAPKMLHVYDQARKKLFIDCAVAGLIFAVILLIHAWKLYTFGNVSLALSEAFGEVLFHLPTIGVGVIFTITFLSSALLAVRLIPNSRCPYLYRRKILLGR